MATPLERRSAVGLVDTPAPSDVGDPVPLGLFGFASATFILSVVLAGWFPRSTILYAMPLVLIFGGIVQFIAGMWSYRRADTFGATFFGAFGSFSTIYALSLFFTRGGLVAGPAYGTGVTGIFVACFALVALLLLVAALRVNMAMVGLLVCLTLAYGLIGAGFIAANAWNLISEGGWAGIGAAMIAFYTAGATLINAVSARTVLPLGQPLRGGHWRGGRTEATATSA